MFLVWLMFGVFVGVILGVFILSMTLARKEQESVINQDAYKFEQAEEIEPQRIVIKNE